MELLSVVIFMAILCGAGAWLASLLQDRESGPIGLGRSWLLGCATLSLALHVPLAVDGQITHRSFGLAAVACVGASILFVGGWWKRRSSTQWGGWLADLPWAGRLVAGAIILAATSHALQTELTGYDARSTFALKARILYDTGDVAGEDFRDVQRMNFNPLYPLLLPLIEAETYWCQGSYEHPGLRLLFVGFVLAIVSVHAAEIRRFAPANIAAFQALLLLLTPMMIDCGEGAGLSGSADLPLAAFVFAGTLDLFRFCRQPTWQRALSAGLLFGAALMTKQRRAALGRGRCDHGTGAARRPQVWAHPAGDAPRDSRRRRLVRRFRFARPGPSQHASLAVLSVVCRSLDRCPLALATCRSAAGRRPIRAA